MNPAVEAPRPAGQEALVSAQGFPQIHDDLRHGELVTGGHPVVFGSVARHAVTDGLPADGSIATCLLWRERWEARPIPQRRQRAEDSLVFDPIARVHLL